MVHLLSVAVGVGQYLFYVIISSFLQYFFYHRQRKQLAVWKTQPHRLGNSRVELDVSYSHTVTSVWWFPLHCLLTSFRKPGRHPLHLIFTTFNLIMSACFAGVVCECYLRGWSNLLVYPNSGDLPFSAWVAAHTPLSSTAWLWLYTLGALVVGVWWQEVAEYGWHAWLMHSKFCYRHLHKYHHFYKSPEVFDDMFMHPLEGFGYYCILYAPAFLYPNPLVSFLGYMSIVGFAGILDHSGIDFKFGMYSTRDHDLHHELYEVNYGFPLITMDVIFGTYRKPPTASQRRSVA